MADKDYKVFLNDDIQGGNAGVEEARRFKREIKIGEPRYDARYFETFPTAWASAYDLQKQLSAYGKDGERAGREAALAVEEWASLFLLYYFGVINLSSRSAETLQQSFDTDLWPALKGTYPYRDDELAGISLLHADDETVAGAYYPEVIFFPSRGRSTWLKSKDLAPYLAGTRLSWAKCCKHLLSDKADAKSFHTFLASVARNVLQSMYRKALDNFREREQEAGRLPAPGTLIALGGDVTRWRRLIVEDPQELMSAYPLVREVSEERDGKKTVVKRTYFLVAGLDQPPDSWVNRSIGKGLPAPRRYERGAEGEILIRHAGRPIPYTLQKEDEVVVLRDCFLSGSPDWCAVPADGGGTAKIRDVHAVKNDGSGLFTAVRQKERAVCLAPVNGAFLKHFLDPISQTPEKLPKITATATETGDGVDWTFFIKDRHGHEREIQWQTRPANSNSPNFNKELPQASFALWPPKLAKEWHLYMARGTGTKEAAGRWSLVDENGNEAQPSVDFVDEYISILHNPKGGCRPAAMLLRDSQGAARGALFLANLEGHDIDVHTPASLAMDFGTSNTCLAYETGASEKPAALTFTQQPVMLWGAPPALENPGFVPFRWKTEEFFPTILMSRKGVAGIDMVEPSKIELHHLFQIDIPGLHSGMEARLYTGLLENNWNVHSNLKWELAVRQAPWRALFWGVSLLYAHAEIFFRERALIDTYVFTFPLAFSEGEREKFHGDAQDAIAKVRAFCYGTGAGTFVYKDQIDESTAIAKSANTAGAPGNIEVFLDVGGGTADIAIRMGDRFLVKDSIKVAGRTFFRFAEKNFAEPAPPGAGRFRKHLNVLLLEGKEFSLDDISFVNHKLGTFYSVAINGLGDKRFREREADILQQRMGRPSYQWYRSILLIRHLLAYALLQACAAAVGSQTQANGISLILAGNAWGLILFAELERRKGTLHREAQVILEFLKGELVERLTAEAEQERNKKEKARLTQEIDRLDKLKILSVNLLNEKNFSDAKTSVAEGALRAAKGPTAQQEGEGDAEAASTSPYAGITIRDLKVGSKNVTIRWCDRWGLEDLQRKIKSQHGLKSAPNITSLEFGGNGDMQRPLDPLLSVFTRLGNRESYEDGDTMPAEEWFRMNSLLAHGRDYLDDNNNPRYSPLNYFISRVLYPEDNDHTFLDEMAKRVGNL